MALKEHMAKTVPSRTASAVMVRSWNKEEGKVKDPCEEPPEEFSGSHGLSCHEATHKAGEDVHAADAQGDLAFRQTKLIKGKGQGR